MDISWFYILVLKVSSRGDEFPPWFTLDYTNDSLFPLCVQSGNEFPHYLQSEREDFLYQGWTLCISR